MNNIYFQGSETAGSVAKIMQPQAKRYEKPVDQTLQSDTVSFRGNMDKSDSAESIGKTIAGIVILASLITGGLGYAHKANWAEKLKSEKFKKFITKITEPCYNLCHKTKEATVKYYNKVKNLFNKKS